MFSQQCNDPNPVNAGFCFGYIMGIADIIADREVLGDDINFIQKPFTINGIATLMQKVLH